MRHHTKGNLTAALLTVGLMLGLTPAVSAAIYERERWAFTDAYTEEDLCGMEIDVEVEASGMVMVREPKPGSTAFYFSNLFEFRETLTNPETGAWVVVRGKGNFREVKAEHVEGDVYRFRAQRAGQAFVVEDSDGRVVYRDRGLVVFEVLFDTQGDDVPGGEELSFEVVELRGHPGYLEDECVLFHELLG